jgi:hypothetical protein
MNMLVASAMFDRWRFHALLIGVGAAALSIVGGFVNTAQFYHSYLFAWLFWLGLSLGALVIVMLQFLTGGAWGAAVRRLCEGAFMTLPMMALLFLPLLLGIHDAFPWSRPNGLAAEGAPHKHFYLSVPFFAARSVCYFALLILFAVLLRRWSVAESERTRAETPRALSAGGLIVYVLCMNFASTDWVMSLSPEWYSTIFVIVFMAGQFLSALALMTVLLVAVSMNRNLADEVSTKVFHDLGNLLLTFIIFWTYVSFSQFLIIWSGNLPREISWYMQRNAGGWQWLALALLVFQFFLPFALLLSRQSKRNRERLGLIALCILAATVVNNFWMIAPAFHPRHFYFHWLDLTLFAAMGGFWFALLFRLLKAPPPLSLEAFKEEKT